MPNSPDALLRPDAALSSTSPGDPPLSTPQPPGDSLGRNQYESLLCLLSAADQPSVSEGENGSETSLFPAYNATVELILSPYLVESSPKKVIRRASRNWTTPKEQRHPPSSIPLSIDQTTPGSLCPPSHPLPPTLPVALLQKDEAEEGLPRHPRLGMAP